MIYAGSERSLQVRKRFVMFRDRANRWRWRFRANNLRIVAASEGYSSKRKCRHGIEVVREQAHGAPVVVQEPRKSGRRAVR